MRDFQLQKRLILVGLAALALADAGLAYYGMKMSSSRQNPEQVLRQQNLRLKLLQQDVERASKIRSHIPEVVKKFESFEESLPPSGKGYSVISQELDEIAKDTHLVVDDVKFHQKDQKETANRNMEELDIEAGIFGDYSGIVRFLNRLQRSRNSYIVDSLQVESSTLPGAPPNALKVTLHLRTFFRKA